MAKALEGRVMSICIPMDFGPGSRLASRGASVLIKLVRASLAAVSLGMSGMAWGAGATLSWSDNSDNESGFYVERLEAGGAWSRIATVGANVTQYVDATVEPNVNYTYRVNAFNQHGESDYTNTASYLLANTPPTIGAVAAQSIAANATSAPIGFSVSDAETPAGSIVVTASSSNSAIISQEGITLGGAGSARTLTLRPAMDASGAVTVTLQASDGLNTVSRSIAVTVRAPVVPTFSIASVTKNADGLAPNGLPVAVTIASNDIGLIQSVEYSVGGTVLQTVASSPFGTTLVFGNPGSVELVATAKLLNSLLTVTDSYALTVAPEPIASSVVNGLRSEKVGTLGGGSIVYSAGEDAFILAASGGAFGGTEDSYQSSHVLVKGDAVLSARLRPLSGASGKAAVGLMLRSNVYPDSSQLSVVVNELGQLRLLSRLATGAALADELLAASVGSGLYVRLDRSGDLVRVATSSDGTIWTPVAERSVHFGAMYLAGLAMADSGGAASARIDRVDMVATVVAWDDTKRAPNAPRALLIGGVAGQ